MLTLDLIPSGDADSFKKQLDAFKINDGDEVHIFPIAPYNEDAIYVQGHVQRPWAIFLQTRDEPVGPDWVV